jgi:hypothetical protein
MKPSTPILAGLWRALEGVAARGFVESFLVLLLALAASAAAYTGAARLLRVEELGLVWRVLRRKGAAAVRRGTNG